MHKHPLIKKSEPYKHQQAPAVMSSIGIHPFIIRTACQVPPCHHCWTKNNCSSTHLVRLSRTGNARDNYRNHLKHFVPRPSTASPHQEPHQAVQMFNVPVYLLKYSHLAPVSFAATQPLHRCVLSVQIKRNTAI